MGLRRKLPGGHIARLTMKIARMGAILWARSPVRWSLTQSMAMSMPAWQPTRTPTPRLAAPAQGSRGRSLDGVPSRGSVPYERRSDALEAGRYELTGNTILEANVLHIERSLLINGATSPAASRRRADNSCSPITSTTHANAAADRGRQYLTGSPARPKG
jgi:hypothetical protein